MGLGIFNENILPSWLTFPQTVAFTTSLTPSSGRQIPWYSLDLKCFNPSHIPPHQISCVYDWIILANTTLGSGISLEEIISPHQTHERHLRTPVPFSSLWDAMRGFVLPHTPIYDTLILQTHTDTPKPNGHGRNL